MFENSPAADLAIGRSSVRQRILALLMSESAGRLHLRAIQRLAATSPGTASRELAKLVAAGLVEREAEGAQVYFRASTTPFAAMMRSLLVIVPAPDTAPRRPKRVPRAAAPTPHAAPTPIAPTPIPAPAIEPVAERVAEVHPATEQIVASATGVTLTFAAQTYEAQAQATDAPQASARPAGRSGATGRPPRTHVAAARKVPAGSASGERAATAAAPSSAEAAAEPPAPRVIRPAAPVLAPLPALTPALAPVLAPEYPETPTRIADPLALLVARRFAESVESLYEEGGHLRGVYLYGERALGSDRIDADIETVIVLDRVDAYGAELERTSHICAALSHELRLNVSRVFVSEADWLNRADGSLPAIRSQAVEI